MKEESNPFSLKVLSLTQVITLFLQSSLQTHHLYQNYKENMHKRRIPDIQSRQNSLSKETLKLVILVQTKNCLATNHLTLLQTIIKNKNLSS